MSDFAQVINTEILSDKKYLLKEVTVNYTETNGQQHTITRQVYERGDAAAAILYNKSAGTIILLNQFRLPTFLNGNPGGMLKEICAGMLDGDTPEVCIRREIREETGYNVSYVTAIGDIYVSPAGCTELIYLFTAPYAADMKTSTGGGLKEEQEFIDIEEVSFEDTLKRIERGEIKDAKTLVLLYHLRVHGIM